MKMKKIPFKRILTFLLIIATLCSTLSSCATKGDDIEGSSSFSSSYTASDESLDISLDVSEDVTDDSNITIDPDAISIFANGEYSIKLIRSTSANSIEKKLCTDIRDLLKKHTGVAPEVSTSQKHNGPAIIIGKTTYTESKNAYKNLGINQATASLLDDKYVITASSTKAAEKLMTSLKALLSKNATKELITINATWNLNVKGGTLKMTKTEWLDQYKTSLSERNINLLGAAYDVLEKNTMQGDNMPWGSNPTISPWAGSTAGVWNWDSVFHAMTVCRYDGELAKNCIDSIAMFQKENGLIPDVVMADGRVVDNYSKPPVFAWGVLEVYKATDDMNFLRRNYDRAVKYEGFWRRDRFDNGLFYYSAQENPEKDNYLHPRWESGWDNSPRWDICPIVDLYPIDLNCYMVLYYRSMAEMAEILGKSSADWKAKEKELTTQIESRLYNASAGAYVDRNRKTGEYSTVLSPASFMPLFIGTASTERAAAMHKIAKDTTKFYPGMPSVSYDNAGYNNDYWRGPTWLNIAFFAIKGLDDYGYTQTANEMKEFILNMCNKSLPCIYENYDSKTQKGKSHNYFSWSSVFVIEFILQFDDKK